MNFRKIKSLVNNEGLVIVIGKCHDYLPRHGTYVGSRYLRYYLLDRQDPDQIKPRTFLHFPPQPPPPPLCHRHHPPRIKPLPEATINHIIFPRMEEFANWGPVFIFLYFPMESTRQLKRLTALETRKSCFPVFHSLPSHGPGPILVRDGVGGN